jgi:hypothetical protein
MIRLLSIAVFWTLSTPLFGQFFIKGGLTNATVNFQESYALTISPITGSLFGMGYDIGIDSSSFSVVIEGVLIQKGAINVYDTHGSARRRIETTAKIRYFEIPVLLKYSIGKKAIQVYFNAGLSLGIGVGGKFDTEVMYQDEYPNGVKTYTHQNGKIVFNKETSQYGGEMNVDNRIDISCQFGAGLLLLKHVVLDFRYGLGLTNLYNQDSQDTDSNPTSKNRVAQFSLGYKFGQK